MTKQYLLKKPFRHLLKGAMVGSFLMAASQGANAGESICFAVADNDRDGDQDVLVMMQKDGGTVEIGTGLTGTQYIEAVTFSLDGKTLYAADGGLFGTLDVYGSPEAGPSGKFTPIGNGFGTGNGAEGEIEFSDVDGLTFDFATGILYGTHRREHTSPQQYDILFQINPATGQFVPDAFGEKRKKTDYVVVKIDGHSQYYDVDDIASDPTDGTMYIVANTGDGVESVLATIDKTTGVATLVDIVKNQGEGKTIDDIESLTFDTNGNLYGSTGNGGAEKGSANPPTKDQLYQINKENGLAASLGRLMPPTDVGGLIQHDFEAVSCVDEEMIDDPFDTCVMYAVHDEGTNDSQIFKIQPFASSGVGAMVPIGPMYKDMDLEGLGILNGILYGTSGYDSCYNRGPSDKDSCGKAATSDGYLYKVDRESGVVTPIGQTGYSEVSGVAVNHQDDTLWAYARGKNGNKKIGILKIDVTTGAGTMVTEFSDEIEVIVDGETQLRGRDFEAIAWDNEGQKLYGMAYVNEKIVADQIENPNRPGTLKKVPKEYIIPGYGSVANYGYSELWAYDKTTQIMSLVCPNVIQSEVEALEIQPNNLLLLGTHKKRKLGIQALDTKTCQIVASRQFVNTPYDDIESIEWPGKECPHRSWLYQTSFDTEIDLIEYEPVPYELEASLREALNKVGMTDAVIEVNGDELTVYYNGFQFTVLATLSSGLTVRSGVRSGKDGVDGELNLSTLVPGGCLELFSTDDADTETWSMCPTSPDPEALDKTLDKAGDGHVDEETGQIVLKLPNGQQITGKLDVAVKPTLIKDGDSLKPATTDKAEVAPAGDADGDGDQDYKIKYPDGEEQLIFVE
jgi:hypothetical protein